MNTRAIPSYSIIWFHLINFLRCGGFKIRRHSFIYRRSGIKQLLHPQLICLWLTYRSSTALHSNNRHFYFTVNNFEYYFETMHNVLVHSHEFRSNLGPKGVVVNNGSCSHNQEHSDDLDVISKMFLLEQKRNKCCKNFKPYIFSILKNWSALFICKRFTRKLPEPIC